MNKNVNSAYKIVFYLLETEILCVKAVLFQEKCRAWGQHKFLFGHYKITSACLFPIFSDRILYENIPLIYI